MSMVNGGGIGDAGLQNRKESAEFKLPLSHPGLNYLDLFSRLNAVREPKSYFEIGTNTGSSVARWSCDSVCVDPKLELNVDVVGKKRRTLLYQTTSDEFFSEFNLHQHFPDGIDIAFLDGMHLCEYLLRDFTNTERFCHQESVVFLHDCLPLNARMAERSYRSGDPSEGPPWAAWTGDVWRFLFVLKKYRPDLAVTYLDCQPTGLIGVSKLNSASDTLHGVYQEAVDYMMSLSFDDATATELWQLYPMCSSVSLANNSERLQNAFEK